MKNVKGFKVGDLVTPKSGFSDAGMILKIIKFETSNSFIAFCVKAPTNIYWENDKDRKAGFMSTIKWPVECFVLFKRANPISKYEI